MKVNKYFSPSSVLFSLLIFTISLTGCSQNKPLSSSTITTDTDIIAESQSFQQGISIETKTIDLIMPTMEDYSNAYYDELLVLSLEDIGYTVNLHKDIIKPQTRIAMDLKENKISMAYFVESSDRNQANMSVNVGLTNGMIGQRVFFIKKGTQSIFDGVTTLDDFVQLNKIAGLGKNWFDVDVWAENNLKYNEIDGDWKAAYALLAKRDGVMDYFPRGINEIIAEIPIYPDLDIEENLVLQYDRDIKFYLSKSAEPMKDVLNEALTSAQSSGLMDQLIAKYWGENLTQLNFSERTVIQLKLP